MADLDSCDVCKFLDKKSPAAVICKTCSETYCSQCAMYHRAFKISRKHVLLKPRKESGAVTKKMLESVNADLEEFTIPKSNASKNTNKSPASKSHKHEQESRVFAPSLAGEFEVYSPDDVKSCFVHCITCLPDDRIVLIDWNNQRLKLFDRNGKLEASEAVAFNSWGVTCTGVDEVAVTNAKQIDFYSIGTNKITKLSKCLNTSCHGRGICCYGNRFVIADESGIILVIDQKGRVIKEFKLFDAFGNKIARCYDAIFDQNGESIIVADRTMGSFRVICLSITSGKALWEVPMASKPYGLVYVGASDTLLVSSSPKNVIYKIDTCKREIGIALNEDQGIYQPEGMVIQYGLGRLLVVDTDCVKMFNIKE